MLGERKAMPCFKRFLRCHVSVVEPCGYGSSDHVEQLVLECSADALCAVACTGRARGASRDDHDLGPALRGGYATGVIRAVALHGMGGAHETHVRLRCFAMPEVFSEDARAFEDHRPRDGASYPRASERSLGPANGSAARDPTW